VKQQPQIILWLLVAATAAVDAVAIAWLVEAGPLSRAAYLIDALMTGQLALVCIWAVFAARRMLASLAAIGLAISVCTALDVWAAWMAARETFGIYVGLAAAYVAILWIIKQTPGWQRVANRTHSGWQFSIGQVLVVMTVVALTLVLLRDTTIAASEEEWKFLAALSISDVLIVVVAVLANVHFSEWWVRLTASCAAAIALGISLTYAQAAGWLGETMVAPFNQEIVPNTAYMLVIALLLVAWIELTPILPLARRAEFAPPAGDTTI